MGFTLQQVETLLRPIKPDRVSIDNHGAAYLESWDVRAHLTRIFGFGGWEKEIVALELIDQSTHSKGGYNVTYRCTMRLTVRDPDGLTALVTDDAATGSAQNQPQLGDAHDLALKTAVSTALKRCAIDLGDQFGLSLYNGGSTSAAVVKTLIMPDSEGQEDSR